MNQAAQESAIKRDERAIFLPAKGEMQKVLAELKEAILYAIQTGDYSRIRKICKGDISSLLNDLTELAYLKGGRRAELAAEKVIEEPASEFAPVQFSLKSDSDARVRGTIDYLRRVSGLDPSKAQDKFEKHNAGEIGDLSDAIVTEVKKAVKDLVERGIHIEGGKDKIAQILAANQVGVLNTTALAETLFRTQSMQAYAAGRWNSAHDKGYGKYIWGFQYVTAHDNRVREGHRVLEGVRLPKDDPFWLKYFPPNGWNCRCTTLEIWTGDPKARIDFGITGKDPRKRTAEEMNVPEAFQGNVGIFTYTKESERQEPIQIPVKTPETKKPESPKKKIAIPAVPKKDPLKPKIEPVFQSPAKRFWYEVLKYVREMYILPDPKKIIKITLTPKGIEFKYNSRKCGYINVYHYDKQDHYTGSFRWLSLHSNDVDTAEEALDTMRQYAARTFSNRGEVQVNEIKFVLEKNSQKLIDGEVERQLVKQPEQNSPIYDITQDSDSGIIHPEAKDIDFSFEPYEGKKWDPETKSKKIGKTRDSHFKFRNAAENAIKKAFKLEKRFLKSVDFGDVDARKSLDCRLVNYYTSGLEDVAVRYPFVKGCVSYITVEDQNAKGKFDKNSKGIILSSRYNFDQICDDLLFLYQGGHRSSRHINHTIYHELGHAYFCGIKDSQGKNREIDDFLRFVQSEYERLDAMNTIEKKLELSEYGAKDIDEMFAECFAECNASSRPRLFALNIINRSKEAVKSLGVK